MITTLSLSHTFASLPNSFLKTPKVPGPHTSCVMSTSTFTQTFSPGVTLFLPLARARIFSVIVIADIACKLRIRVKAYWYCKTRREKREVLFRRTGACLLSHGVPLVREVLVHVHQLNASVVDFRSSDGAICEHTRDEEPHEHGDERAEDNRPLRVSGQFID